jgi:tetrahydromethanopterin S-methyltransferase subunit B
VRFVIADNRLYAITLTGDEEEFQQNETLVNQILDSFQPKNPQQEAFSMRALWIALGAACVSGVLFMGLILLLVRKLSR